VKRETVKRETDAVSSSCARGQKQSSLRRQEKMGAPYTFEAELGAEKMVETGDFCGISGFAHFN